MANKYSVGFAGEAGGCSSNVETQQASKEEAEIPAMVGAGEFEGKIDEISNEATAVSNADDKASKTPLYVHHVSVNCDAEQLEIGTDKTSRFSLQIEDCNKYQGFLIRHLPSKGSDTSPLDGFFFVTKRQQLSELDREQMIANLNFCKNKQKESSRTTDGNVDLDQLANSEKLLETFRSVWISLGYHPKYFDFFYYFVVFQKHIQTRRGER